MQGDRVSRMLLSALLVSSALAGCSVGARREGIELAPERGGGAELVERHYVNPEALVVANGFSHAVRHGRLLYLGSELPLDQNGQVVGGDRETQMKVVFQNIQTLLATASSSPADVLRLTIYLVDLSPDDWDLLRRSAPEFFPSRNAPAVTLLGVQALGKSGALVAVDGVALMTGLLPPGDSERPQRQ